MTNVTSTNAQTPEISVVIPTCHRNDLLARALDQLAPGAQTLESSRYEVIVSDDGSRSTAEELVRDKYPWARWVSGPRKGPASNRNFGASQSRAEWIAFTDDDCVPKPGWLEAYLAATKSGLSVYEGRTTCEDGVSSPLETSPVNERGGLLWSCNMMVRRALFQELGGFDTGFPAPCNEDVEFRDRLKRLGFAFEFVPDAVVDHPPRPQLRGFAMGRRDESQVRLWYARGNRKPAGVKLITHLFLVRMQEIRWSPRGVGSLLWFSSAVLEAIYIATHLRRWNAKHRDAYRATFDAS